MEASPIKGLDQTLIYNFFYALLGQKGEGYITPRLVEGHASTRLEELLTMFKRIGVLEWSKGEKNRYNFTLDTHEVNRLAGMTPERMVEAINDSIVETILLVE